LDFNSIETVDGDLLLFTPEVEFLRLSHNKITNFGPNLLDNLINLSYMDLGENLCISQTATTPTEILNLIRSLAHLCPPTAQMIERIIVSGDKFVEVTENIEDNQSKTQRLENRVLYLERIIMEIDALNKVKDDRLRIIEAELVVNKNKFAEFEIKLTSCIKKKP
jgi:hypothetical protein